jgi:hypothetical protein
MLTKQATPFAPRWDDVIGYSDQTNQERIV